MTRRMMVAGNWKMHGSRAMAAALTADIVRALPAHVDVVVFPPFPYLAQVADTHAGSGLGVGAQDVGTHAQAGAFTGEISAPMLVDCGCRHVLVGHSERRQYHQESNELVAEKFAVAWEAGLTPVLCVGETLEQRQAGEAQAVVAAQLDAVLHRAGVDAFERALVAYEPVWAIGTGQTATAAQAQDMHAFIRSHLAKDNAKIGNHVRVLYGGSVKPSNAAELFAQEDVDGGLIGGASLVAADFLAICAAAR
jgi:triosephosphate isomerase (TIM)